MKQELAPFLMCIALAAAASAGCSASKSMPSSHVNLNPTVKIASPEMREIRTQVSQPGVIEPYEQTAIYSKVPGYVLKWYVDIGSHVKKDELLAEILVPELKEEQAQKEALVEQDRAMAEQARRQVTVSESKLDAAEAEIAVANANLKRYDADVERWTSEMERLTSLVKEKVMNPEVLAETHKQVEVSQASKEAALAEVKSKQSEAASAKAQVEKSKADLKAAEVKITVSEAEARRVAAIVAYTKILAPYDGVITARNVNTGDFVRPASGPSGGAGAEVGSGGSTPLFVVARTDPMMFVIGVPETDAAYVSAGSKAKVRLSALTGRELNLTVTRTSMALNNQSRTLKAEIDVPNPKGELLPGLYAYGTIEINRANVLAIPASAIVEVGNRNCCYMVKDGVAVRTPIQTGVSDGTWTEVIQKNSEPSGNGEWTDFNSGDQIIFGDLSEVANGKQVTIDTNKPAVADAGQPPAAAGGKSR